MAISRKARQRRGFTLMEAMVAAIVLATGLLSVLSLFAYSLSNLQMSQEDLIARAKAKEGLESVFSARDSSQIDFSQINNKANGGIFLDDFAPIYDPPGTDGIANTDDDSNSANSHQSFHQRQTLLAFFYFAHNPLPNGTSRCKRLSGTAWFRTVAPCISRSQ